MPRSTLYRAGATALLCLAVLAVPATGRAGAERPPTPHSFDLFEELILERLTPEQAEAFAAGADPATIVLDGGTTLAELLTEGLIDTDSSSAYHPLNHCVVVHTQRAVGKFGAGDERGYIVRGPSTNLSAQGGNAAGCGVAWDAVAVVVNVKVYSAAGNGQAFVYAAGHIGSPSVLNFQPSHAPANNMVIVPLDMNALPGVAPRAEFEVRMSQAAHLVVHVVGYFSPLDLGPVDADTLDGLDSTDFAAYRHDHDARYPSRAELATPDGPADVHWTNLTGVPQGLDDGDGCATVLTGNTYPNVVDRISSDGQVRWMGPGGSGVLRSGPWYYVAVPLPAGRLRELRVNQHTTGGYDYTVTLDGANTSPGIGCAFWAAPIGVCESNPAIAANVAAGQRLALRVGGISSNPVYVKWSIVFEPADCQAVLEE